MQLHVVECFALLFLDGSFPPVFITHQTGVLIVVRKAAPSLAASSLVDLVHSWNYQTLCDASTDSTDSTSWLIKPTSLFNVGLNSFFRSHMCTSDPVIQNEGFTACGHRLDVTGCSEGSRLSTNILHGGLSDPLTDGREAQTGTKVGTTEKEFPAGALETAVQVWGLSYGCYGFLLKAASHCKTNPQR